jgi:hypothetical protein
MFIGRLDHRYVHALGHRFGCVRIVMTHIADRL